MPSINARVPSSNGGTSNTPNGPFIINFVTPCNDSKNSATDFGPASNPIYPSGMPVPPATVSTVMVSPLSMGPLGNDAAQTASTGTTNCLPFALACSINSFAVSTILSSTNDDPMGMSMARRNVNANPPQSNKTSILSNNPLMTGNFVDTLDPPIMAAIFCGGAVVSIVDATFLKSKYASSLATRAPIPHNLGSSKDGTPAVLACARWQVPKASFTYPSA